jgi:tetrahydrodipicolinate N-acetyltransferase
MKGVRIGSGAVVGAGSIVVADVAPNTLVAGSPAKTIRNIDGWQ